MRTQETELERIKRDYDRKKAEVDAAKKELESLERSRTENMTELDRLQRELKLSIDRGRKAA